MEVLLFTRQDPYSGSKKGKADMEWVLYTSVEPKLLRKKLWFGTMLAGIGGLTLLLAGVFLPVTILSTWGWLIAIGAWLLIAYGLIPYKRLKQKEENPDSIKLGDDEILYYYQGNREACRILFSTIENVAYRSGDHYGITMREKSGAEKFFPYFNEKAFRTLRSVVDQLTPA